MFQNPGDWNRRTPRHTKGRNFLHHPCLERFIYTRVAPRINHELSWMFTLHWIEWPWCKYYLIICKHMSWGVDGELGGWLQSPCVKVGFWYLNPALKISLWQGLCKSTSKIQGIFSAPHFSPSITASVHGPKSTLEALAFPPPEEGGVARFPILRLTSKSPTEAKCSWYWTFIPESEWQCFKMEL